MSASGALRVNALNGPTRQVLQAVSPLWNDALLFRWRSPGPQLREKLRGFCAAALVVSSEKIQFLVVRLPEGCRISSVIPVFGLQKPENLPAMQKLAG